MSGVSTSQDIEALPEDCLLLRSLKVIQTQCYDDCGLRETYRKWKNHGPSADNLTQDHQCR